MFGLSFGEVILLAVVMLVVVGPRNLPAMMRSLGKTVAKVKRTAYDLRAQSGIDEILRNEGIEREIEQLRRLAQGRILDVDLAPPEPRRPLPPSAIAPAALLPTEVAAPADPYAEIVLDSEASAAPGTPPPANLSAPTSVSPTAATLVGSPAPSTVPAASEPSAASPDERVARGPAGLGAEAPVATPDDGKGVK